MKNRWPFQQTAAEVGRMNMTMFQHSLLDHLVVNPKALLNPAQISSRSGIASIHLATTRLAQR
jgi:hypothetical protein